jgi:hypothetical protein
MPGSCAAGSACSEGRVMWLMSTPQSLIFLAIVAMMVALALIGV